ncbi:MAG: ketol-acid reductoisomerase, partial [Caulobacteraceae bacterium]
MRVYRDRDADLARLLDRKIAVVGYGAQGHAQALNLRDAGVGELAVALAAGSASADRARAEGLRVAGVAEAAAWADLIVMLAPDELHGAIYAQEIAPHLRDGGALLFAHGFSIHFGLIAPRADLDILMVAAKGPGRAPGAKYLHGAGLACLIAVAQDATGGALDLGLAYGLAIGCGRVGMIETSFREECETDLFGAQAVLCGGVVGLIRAGFETLVEGGCSPEMAYFECLHELKLVVDLICERGIAGMHAAISNTAEFGEYVTGPRMVTPETRAEMKRVLTDIRSGRFARDWMADCAAGQPTFKAARRHAADHPIEEVGARLRAMMARPAAPNRQFPFTPRAAERPTRVRGAPSRGSGLARPPRADR